MGTCPVTKPASRSDVDRLGKRGSYRLGGIGPPGGAPPAPPRPLQPQFIRPQHQGSAAGRILAAVTASILVAGAALAGIWYMPFVVGLATGVSMRWAGWRLRVTVPAVTVMTIAGWSAALWVLALRGQPVGATARAIATIAGLPGLAALTVAITLAVSALLGLAGLWLGRALAPRPARD
jgi:hypothetical protein